MPFARAVVTTSVVFPVAAVVLALVATPGRAQEPAVFSIPAEDGYGIGECMQPGSACGQAMANSWCEAHGHLKAVAFGAADLTGSVPGASSPAGATGATLIRCGD